MPDILKAVLASAAMLFAVCCGNGDTSPAAESAETTRNQVNLEIYTNEENGFAIGFPTDWNVLENVLGTAVTAYSPMANGSDHFRESVSVTVLPLAPGTDLDAFFEQEYGNKANLYQDFREVERNRVIIGGTDAIAVIYTYSLGGRHAIELMYAAAAGETGYVILCEAVPDSFDNFSSLFEAIASSFEILN